MSWTMTSSGSVAAPRRPVTAEDMAMGYRHFPTRQDLLEAVSADWIAQLRDDAARRLGERDPRASLMAWLRDVVGHVATYRGLAAALMTGMDDPDHRCTITAR